jgi:hypothetical protein
MGEEMLSYCFNTLLGKISDSAYFSIQECLLSQNHMKYDFSSAMSSWILDYTRKDSDPLTPSHFSCAEEILDGVYNMGVNRNKFSAMFVNLISRLEKELPEDGYITAIKAVIATPQSEITEETIRSVDKHFLALACSHSNVWNKVYRKFDTKHGLASMIGGITALCHRGTMTINHLQRVINGVSTVCDLGEVLTTENAGSVYKVIRALIPPEVDSKALFEKFEYVFTAETNLRMNLIIKQAAKSGVSAVTIIMQAMKVAPSCAVWSYLIYKIPHEMDAFKIAAEAIADNPYIGFDLGKNLPDHVRSTGFKSVLAAAITVLKTINPSSTVQKYRNVPHSDLQDSIDRIVSKWSNHRGAVALGEQFEEGGADFKDIKSILNEKKDIWSAFE